MRFRRALAFLGCFSILSCSGSCPGGTSAQQTAPWERSPPSATAYTAAEVSNLREAWDARPDNYVPRTRHLREDGSPQFTNRLFLESSPYLRQHAHNPVNWYPWGPEAFAMANKLGRPVLLSVGYSTCHWCHVMEEESFEDLEIAAFLNTHYVAIKVDREERPDIDDIYMAAVQLLTRRGGWPMTVWLTPDREPYYGGTYFPPRDGVRGSRAGFLTLLGKLKDEFATDPQGVAQKAADLAARIETMKAAPSRSAAPDVSVLNAAYATYEQMFDGTYGGLRRAPKFPSEINIRLLLRHLRRTGVGGNLNGEALTMLVLTLEKMAAGGMYDHVAGGFHRYSTDGRWLVPHFEKMLYDNALLAVAYLEAYRLTRGADFRRVAEEILRYVEKDMTSPGGAFYSATDADSANPAGEREEGWFFTWTPSELDTALPAEQAAAVKAYYAVAPGGNFEGRSILYTPRRLSDVAKGLKISEAELNNRVQKARETLYRVRAERPAPLRDEKILTAWNGLMISAFAQGALVLGETAYAKRAASAADFVLKNLRTEGRLLRSHKDGQAKHRGYLDDYAFLVAGLLDLFEATGELRWVREAIALDAKLDQYYAHPLGGYYQTASDHEELLVRSVPIRDGAVPSGNSVHARNLLRLFALTTQDQYRQRAVQLFEALGGVARRSPTSVSELLVAADFDLDSAKEVVIVYPEEDASRGADLVHAYAEVFHPNAVLVHVSEGQAKTGTDILPILRGKTALQGMPTAYVCEEGACSLPTADPETLRQQLTVAHAAR